MVVKVRDINPPQGFARSLYRFPIFFYRIGLGGLLGTRLLLLTHKGLKSGLLRKTVLEVVDYDRQNTWFIVAAVFGPKSDWYQNILADPKVTVQCGRRVWPMMAEFLPPQEAGDVLLTYARKYPFAMKELAQFMGYRMDGTEADIRALGEKLNMVRLLPDIEKLR
jgi:deazaflavin-dependent oxidoreductase (nitroreductase family)